MSDEPKLTIEDKEEAEQLDNATIKVTLTLERIFDPNRPKNNIMMTQEAARFKEKDSGKDEIIGEISHGIPVHTVISDKLTGEEWVLNFADLFTEYTKARKEMDVIEKHIEEEETPEENVILGVDEQDPDNNKVGC